MNNKIVVEILEEMRRKLVFTSLKGLGLTIAATNLVFMLCAVLNINNTVAPVMLGLFSVFFIAIEYTAPRYQNISETYRQRVLEELERMKDEE